MRHQGVKVSSAGAWVLVVHRGAMHARLAETILEAAGYEVVSASEPEEVSALIETYRPNVVVLAEGKPVLLAEQLEGFRAPIIAVSSEDAPNGDEGAVKVYPLWRLAAAIEEELGSPARISSNGSKEV